MRFDPTKDYVTVSFSIKPRNHGGFAIYFKCHLNGTYWRSSQWEAETYREAKAVVQKVLVSHWRYLETSVDLGASGICLDCSDPRSCKLSGCPRRTLHGNAKELGAFEVEFADPSAEDSDARGADF